MIEKMTPCSNDVLNVAAYYDQEPVAKAEATGAGLIWFMGRDHLSPPLSNADEYALNSKRWREASSNRVVDLAQRMGVQPGDWVLDLGCGIGGPGRDITERTGAMVTGMSISIKQLENLQRISQEVNSPFIDTIMGDMQHIPVQEESFDHIYSINAIYHVNDPAAAISESHRVLKSGGRFAVDDWFVTDKTTDIQHKNLRYNWSTGANGFHNFSQFQQSIKDTGFNVIEVQDFTEEAGKFLTEDRFGSTYDDQIAPTLIEAFPQMYKYDGYEPDHAKIAVAQLRSDILYMGDLYRSGDAVYRQIIAEKP
jgi:cyclopropane fatty-acyl-phospholipid synthase-like methyltransferase